MAAKKKAATKKDEPVKKADALVIAGSGNLPAVEVSVADIKEYICKGASDKELKLFLGICESYQLNPFKREIHFVKYGNSAANTIVGYEVYLKRAERTGQLDGWSVEMSNDNRSATITIHRKDREKPFIWSVDREEFDKGQSTWKAMPNFMLKKVAIAQGMRLAFPDEIGGMPYTPDELPAQMTGGLTSEQLDKKVIDVDAEEVEPAPTQDAQDAVKKSQEEAAAREAAKTEPPAEEPAAEEPAAEEPADGENRAGFPDPTGESWTDTTKLEAAFGQHDVDIALLEKWRQLKKEEWTESVRQELLGLYGEFKSGGMTKADLVDMLAEEPTDF